MAYTSPETDLIPVTPRESTKAQHWPWLIACSAIVIAAYYLEVRGNEQVGTTLGPDFVLPTLCLYRKFLGINCPGCGLTRSFIHLAHGNWQASWQAHRLGWLFVLAVVVQFPYRVYRLYRPGRIRAWEGNFFWVCAGAVGLILANWLLNLCLAI